MALKIEELEKDIAELQSFETQASRRKVKDLLSLEITKLTLELKKLQEQQNAPAPKTGSANKRYQVKLNNYAWDQSSKFVKFYVTVPKVHTIPPDNVICNFTNKSLELTICDLDNKDYIFNINYLLNAIDPEQSNWKIKTDLVLINAAKVKDNNWPCVTQLEKKSKDAQNFKPDDNVDPSEGLMSLMKNMYDQGDDEMKRTIAKAWTESQMKSGAMP